MKLNIGNKINTWRMSKKLSMLDVSVKTGIDQALISKYESGKRIPSEKHIHLLAMAMDQPVEVLRKEILADKIAMLLRYEANAGEILKAAEDRMDYLLSNKAMQVTKPSSELQDKLETIDVLKKHWQKGKPLNALQLQKLEAYFDVKYTFNSNRIEGNTLSLQETHLVINEGITIGGKSMREHLEAINHQEAINWLKAMVNGHETFNERNLLTLHQLVLKSIDPENCGRYRNVPVRIGGSNYLPPQPYLLHKLMEEYFVHYNTQKRLMHPVLLAAEMHERLVSIHPFIDGNGRTSRLIMNFLLLKEGYTTVILKGDFESRMNYYKALEEVQVNNNPEPFYHLIADRAIDSLNEHLELI